MDEAIAEYWDARTRIVKSFRKLNNKIGPENKHSMKYNIYKNSVMLELRKMDKVLGGIRRDMEKRVY